MTLRVGLRSERHGPVEAGDVLVEVEGAATWTPPTSIQAEEMRCEPSASPFWTRRVKGLVTVAGTVIVVV